ncbi:hypothetical protein Tco_0744121 [Tanacetum coccineum]
MTGGGHEFESHLPLAGVISSTATWPTQVVPRGNPTRPEPPDPDPTRPGQTPIPTTFNRWSGGGPTVIHDGLPPLTIIGHRCPVALAVASLTAPGQKAGHMAPLRFWYEVEAQLLAGLEGSEVGSDTRANNGMFWCTRGGH